MGSFVSLLHQPLKLVAQEDEFKERRVRVSRSRWITLGRSAWPSAC